jgi:transposase
MCPLLPPPAHTGRPRADDRRIIEGILYVLVIGCRWQNLPREYGAPTTVWRRLKRWGEEGIWERMWCAVSTPTSNLTPPPSDRELLCLLPLIEPSD